MAPRTRGSDYKTLTIDFMKTMGLRPCFKAWTINGSLVRKNPKGELSALRLELYGTAQSVADLEYWSRQVRSLRNGKRTGIWRKGDLQLDFRHGIMDLLDLQGRIWTASEWDLLRNGVEAENGRVAVFETKANTVEGPVETSALDTKQGFESRAWEATMSYVMSLSEHRQGMLRVILNDKTIDPEWRAKVASALLNRWIDDDARGGALLDSKEELLDCEGSSVSEEVSSGPAEGVINEVDIDDGTQNMEVLVPLEEQQDKEFAEDRNRVFSETEVASAPDVGST